MINHTVKNKRAESNNFKEINKVLDRINLEWIFGKTKYELLTENKNETKNKS